MRVALMVVLSLCACNRSDGLDTGPTTDTGWFSDTASPENCPGVVVDVRPDGGPAKWYWRDMPQVWTGNDRKETYQASLWQGSTQLPSNMVWRNGVSFHVNRSEYPRPNTTYSFNSQTANKPNGFRSRRLNTGSPLRGGQRLGVVHLFDRLARRLGSSRVAFRPFCLCSTTPILLMVNYADDDAVDFGRARVPG